MIAGREAVSLPTLLHHLADRTARHRDDPSVATPQVRLVLGGGEVVTGLVLAVADNDATALIAAAEPSDRSYSLVRLDAIAAAQVAPDVSLDELFGAPSRRPAVAPTKLELARHLEEVTSRLVGHLHKNVALRVLWPDFPRTDVAMSELRVAIDSIESTLRGIADDPLGREALEPIEAIELRRGAAIDTSRDGVTLWLTLAVRGNHITAPTAKHIEAVL